MKRQQSQSTANSKQRKTSFGSFITVNSRSLSSNKIGGSSKPVISLGATSDFNLPGCVFESKLTPEECCYHVFLQAQESFVVIFVDEERLPETAGILRILVPNVISITLKTQRAQAAKSLAAAAVTNSSSKGGLIIMSPQMAVFTDSCLPERLKIKVIIHIGTMSSADFERRTLSEKKIVGGTRKEVQGQTSKTAKAEHIHILTPGAIRIAGDIRRYNVNKSWTSVVQSRVAAARKLHFAMIEGKTLNHGKEESMFSDFEETKSKNVLNSEEDARKGVAGKIEALRNKLKILMSLQLPDNATKKVEEVEKKKEKGKEIMPSSGLVKVEASGIALPKVDSSVTIREKMEILGMIASPKKGGEKHKLAELGRSLAATKWIAGSTNEAALCGECYPWGEIRYGASYDTESLKARDILNAFREYVTTKSGGRVPKRWEESSNVSKKVTDKLKECRIVGFGWRPHIRGDGEWGGAYGKCCGHNEVVMFYCKPFAPMEVLNTHVCSKVSPAPGNDGYDGCLEFLQAQCRWFVRAMTVWDDKYFHFIGPDGIDRPVVKSTLLSQSIPKLKVLMLNMRYLTAQCEGQISPESLINTVDLLLSLAAGTAIVDGLKSNLKVHRLICSYLLMGNSGSWSKASK